MFYTFNKRFYTNYVYAVLNLENSLFLYIYQEQKIFRTKNVHWNSRKPYAMENDIILRNILESSNWRQISINTRFRSLLSTNRPVRYKLIDYTQTPR